MKIVNKLPGLLLILIFFNSAYADNKGSSMEELFSLSNLAYMDGRYEEAIKGYEKMIKKGLINPHVYYNLGNAYVKAGKGGLALLNYEKSLELAPRNEDAKYNLSLVREQLALSGPSIDASPPWEGLKGLINFAQSAKLTFFFYTALFLTFSAMLLAKDENLRLKLKKAGTALVAATLVSAAIASYELYRQESLEKGIIIAATTGLYEVPLEQGNPEIEINEGVKVTLLASDNEWLKVSTPDGFVGWVKIDTVGII